MMAMRELSLRYGASIGQDLMEERAWQTGKRPAKLISEKNSCRFGQDGVISRHGSCAAYRSLQPTGQQQNEQNHDNQAQSAAGGIAPVRAVRPGRQRANKEQD